MLMYGRYERFVMQMYVCVLCASCGSSQCCILHDLQCVNAGRGCKRRPYGRGMECKNQSEFIYEDDVCLMASSEDDMNVTMEQVKECVIEYGLKVNDKKSRVVCIHGEIGRRRWMMGDCCIGEVEEYKYLRVTVEGRNNGGFRSMGD